MFWKCLLKPSDICWTGVGYIIDSTTLVEGSVLLVEWLVQQYLVELKDRIGNVVNLSTNMATTINVCIENPAKLFEQETGQFAAGDSTKVIF